MIIWNPHHRRGPISSSAQLVIAADHSHTIVLKEGVGLGFSNGMLREWVGELEHDLREENSLYKNEGGFGEQRRAEWQSCSSVNL